MAKITPEVLHAYLDDALSEGETVQLERALRDSEKLRRQLRSIMQDRDRGEHSIGAIWRRQRLSCPTRDQLGSFFLQALEPGWQDYIDFHLNTVACPFCLANLADLKAMHKEPETTSHQRRRRFFESSAGYLQGCRETPQK